MRGRRRAQRRQQCAMTPAPHTIPRDFLVAQRAGGRIVRIVRVVVVVIVIVVVAVNAAITAAAGHHLRWQRVCEPQCDRVQVSERAQMREANGSARRRRKYGIQPRLRVCVCAGEVRM